jgi:antitoxin CptB
LVLTRGKELSISYGSFHSQQHLIWRDLEIMDARRKKLIFQSQHCGIKENDILLGQFASYHIEEFSDQQLDLFEALLNENDHDIYGWITGQEPLPTRIDHDVMAALIKFKHAR